MTAKRPNLAALADAAGSVRAVRRPIPQAEPTPDQAEPAGAAQPAGRYVAPSRDGKKPITAFFPEEVRTQLKMMAVEQSRSMDSLMAEALNDLFAKYGRPEIAPTSSRRDRAA